MTDYPRMLYRKGDKDSPEIHGLRCETQLVDDASEEKAAQAEGWRRSPHGAYDLEPPQPDVDIAGCGEDERTALLQEVEELHRRVSELTTQLEAERAAREAAEKERDESRELIAAFDRDNDGKPGGSKPKEKLTIKTDKA